MTTDNLPDFSAVSPIASGSGTHWLQLGAGFRHGDGVGVNVLLEKLPPLDPESGKYKITLFAKDAPRTSPKQRKPASASADALPPMNEVRAKPAPQRPAPTDDREITAARIDCPSCQGTRGRMVDAGWVPCKPCNGTGHQ